jgi:hypothetical protein
MLDPYYNPESEHFWSSRANAELAKLASGAPLTAEEIPNAVRRVCSTQSEVRVYSNSVERWHYMSCPIVPISPDAKPDGAWADWLRRQDENVREGLSRIARADWVDGTAYKKVIIELKRANAMIPEGFTYKRATQ